MSVMLESRMLRDFLHRLVDNLMNDLEANPKVAAVAAVLSVPSTATTKPRITLEPLAKKPPQAKATSIVDPKTPRKPGRQPRGDVVIGCTKRGAEHQVVLTIAAAIVSRLGLGPKLPCDCGLSLVGRTFVLGPGRGARLRQTYAGQRHVLRLGGPFRWGVLQPHHSEACAWHFDLENRLVIQVPPWLKGAPPPTKQVGPKGKTAPAVSCKKMAGTNPTIKCAICKKATATVECSRCPTLLCDGCWETHVRKHWHTAVTSKPPVGNVADLKE